MSNELNKKVNEELSENEQIDNATDYAIQILNKRFHKYCLYICVCLFFLPLGAFWLFFHDSIFHDIAFKIMWGSCIIGGIGIIIYAIILARRTYKAFKVFQIKSKL